MLGMAIESCTPMGAISGPDEEGELVCVKPFPCMPLGFWPLPGFGNEIEVGSAKVRYHQAYFSEFEGVWCEFVYRSENTVILKAIIKTTGITLSSHVRRLEMEAEWSCLGARTVYCSCLCFFFFAGPADPLVGIPGGYDSDHRSFTTLLISVSLDQLSTAR